MSATWILAIALVLVIHVEAALRNLVDAVETQGLYDEDLESLHAAVQNARRYL